MTARRQPPLFPQAESPATHGATASHAATVVFDVPPSDVRALLDSEQGTLLQYFDAQRVDALLRLRRDWPQLWRMAPATS